mgnify:FL=1
MMDEPVYYGLGHHLVIKYMPPFIKAVIACEYR